MLQILGHYAISIEYLLEKSEEILDNNLMSVIISRSTALGDYIYDKGNIDFFVVTKDDLTIKNSKEIFKLYEGLQTGELGAFGIQLKEEYIAH